MQFFFSLLVCVLPGVLLLSWHVFRWRLISIKWLLVFSIWGIASPLLAVQFGALLNQFLPALTIEKQGVDIIVPNAKALWMHSLISIGPVEELSKSLLVLLLVLLRRANRTIIFVGMTISAAIFSSAENAYAAHIMNSVGTAFLRVLTSFPLHLTFAMMGCSLLWWAQDKKLA